MSQNSKLPGEFSRLPKGFRPPLLNDPSLPLTPDIFPTSLTGKGTRGDASGKLVKINPNDIERLAVQFDTKGYNLADQDFAQRFPELVAGRDYNIAHGTADLGGAVDSNVQGALNQSGLGDIQLKSGEYNKARDLGAPIMSMEQRDRSYFQRLLGMNPQRAFGLNSQDIAHIAVANTGMANANASGQYGSRLNQYLAGVQQAGQNQAALIGGIGSLAGAGIRAFGSNYGGDSYLSPTGYGSPYSYSAAGDVTSAGGTSMGNIFNANEATPGMEGGGGF